MSYIPPNPNGAATGANSSPVVTATDDTNLKGFAASSAGGYVRQDSNATIAKESGGNLAAAKADLDTIVTNTGASATAANQTNGTQQTKLTNGTNIADVVAGDSGFNGVATASATKTYTFTTSASGAQTLLANTPTEGFSWIEIIYTSVGSGLALTGQFAPNSGGTYINSSTFATPTSPQGGVLGTTVNNIYFGAIHGNYFQIAVSALTSGTFSGYVILRSNNPGAATSGAQQSGTWTVGSNSATGSAVPANAFYVGVNNGSGNLGGLQASNVTGDAGGAGILSTGASIYNGTNWDRTRSATAAANTTGTGLLGAAALGFDGTNYQRITVNSTTYTSKFGADANLLGTLGTAFSTAGKVDVKGADGDVFVRQATAANLNATVVGTGTFAVQAAGGTASGSSLAASPLTTGGLAKTANPTAVSDGQVVNALYDKLGKAVVVGSIRDLKVNQVTTITASTAETTVLTQVASTFLDVYGVIVTNTSATAVTVAFKDSTSGTTQFNVAVPAGDTRGFMLPEGGAMKQGTVNNNWTATTQSVTSVIITMLAVKNT